LSVGSPSGEQQQ